LTFKEFSIFGLKELKAFKVSFLCTTLLDKCSSCNWFVGVRVNRFLCSKWVRTHNQRCWELAQV